MFLILKHEFIFIYKNNAIIYVLIEDHFECYLISNCNL
jgi:hypothetical protein